MTGLLIYGKEFYKINNGYANWLIEEFKKNGIELKFMFKEDLLTEGLKDKDEIKFVINRSRSYEVNLMFELNGIRVFNNSEIVLLGNNKLAAYKYAKDKGYPYKPIIIDWSSKDAKNIISKTTDGSGGYDVGLVNEINIYDGKNRFQQELAKDIIGDLRFYVIGNKIIHAVLRTSNKIMANFLQGGNVEFYNYSKDEEAYVLKFIDKLNIDYAGVDFLLTKDRKLIFNEIEDVVGSRMLNHLGVNDTVELFTKHIIDKISFER